MEEKDFNESNDETRARGVKRNSEIKITEVTTSKKKRAKKATAEAPEPDALENLFKEQHVWTEEKEKRSRLKEAAKDAAEGNLTLEDLTKAIRDACTQRNLRLGDQGAFYNSLTSKQRTNSIWRLFSVQPQPLQGTENAQPPSCAPPSPSQQQTSTPTY